ncbi:MAG: nucleotide-binding universal stress UspA family protein [Rhodothermales bacterium]|jgi:nucleotide-binding universal stress UspA family protein
MHAPAKLLVGLDFGPTTEATLETASLLASRLDGELLLSHAIEYVPRSYGVDFAEEKEVLRHVNESLTQRCEALRSTGITAEAMPARFGSALTLLLEDMEDTGATALVLGVGEQGLIKRLFLGTNAEKLVRTSPWPVFLRHPADAEEDFRSLLCAVDFSDHAKRTLANAADFAREFGSELHVLHVEQPPVVYPGTQVPLYVHPPPSTTDLQAQLDAFIAEVDTRGIPVTTHLTTGKPGEEIIRRVVELKPGLLVLGKHGQGGVIDRLIGGVATHILRNLPCSLLVIGERDL